MNKTFVNVIETDYGQYKAKEIKMRKDVEKLVKKAVNAETPDDAMTYSQAALNVAHAAAALHLEPIRGKKL